MQLIFSTSYVVTRL